MNTISVVGSPDGPAIDERELGEWIKNNPGKTLPDYLTQTTLNATYLDRAGAASTYSSKPVKPALDLSPLPGLLRGEYNYNAVSFIQDNLCTFGDTQYAVYWGTDQSGYITKRTLPNGPWSTPVRLQDVAGNPLQTPVTDDAHNTIVVGVDPTGNVHVAGNHHNFPLRYMRTTTPGDLSTFTAGTMLGVNEDSVTYPQFVLDQASGKLFFFYRNGSSGYGNEYVRRLDGSTWVNPVAGTLIDGIASNESPYMQHISSDANGLHLFWCWRESPSDAGSNTDMTYMRSSDGGVTWKKENGQAVTIPATHANSNVIWDTAQGSGMVNQNGATVDSLGHPHTVFHEYDANGKTQIAHVWYDGTAWQHELVTKYLTRRMETVGQGLITVEISRPTIVASQDGRVYVIYRTLFDDRRGTVRAVDVTPGTTDRRDFSICNIDLWEWEPTFDTQAAKNRNELHMIIHPALNNGSVSVGFNWGNAWRRQYGAVLTIDMAQMAAIRGGTVRLPSMRTLSVMSPLLNNPVFTNTADADVALGSLLTPTYLPTQKGKVLFARWRARANTVTASGATGRFRLKLTDGVNTVTAGDLVWTSSASKLYETPWLPFPEFPQTPSPSISWVTIQGSTTDAAGTRFTIAAMELAYIDF